MLPDCSAEGQVVASTCWFSCPRTEQETRAHDESVPVGDGVTHRHMLMFIVFPAEPTANCAHTFPPRTLPLIILNFQANE